MLVYSYIKGNNKQAIWNSFFIHISRFSKFEKEITVFCKKIPFSFDQNSFSNVKIERITNYFDLLLKLIKSKDDKLLIAGVLDVLILLPIRIFSNKKLIFWVQGVFAEEMNIKKQYKVIFFISSFLERIAFCLSHKFLFVSSAMQDYYETKYKKSYIFDSVVLPCTSDLKYFHLDKIPDSFTYVGGTSTWQKLDDIIKLFSIIAMQNPNAKLFIITKDQKTIFNLLNKFLCNKYKNQVVVKTLNDRNEIQAHLLKMEYGFLIRDQHIVNEVSSPIKLAEYLSCGVFPLISPSIKSYSKILEQRNSALIINDLNDIIKLKEINININNLLESYMFLFSEEKILSRYAYICQ